MIDIDQICLAIGQIHLRQLNSSAVNITKRIFAIADDPVRGYEIDADAFVDPGLIL